jgi:malonyl-CoA O-methyltransferase
VKDFYLDKKLIRRSFANAAESYDGMANLQRQVGRELIKQVLSAEQSMILDVGCGTGFFTEQLFNKFTTANIIALDIAEPMLSRVRQRQLAGSLQWVCADAESLPFVGECVDSVVSNLALQWCQELKGTLAGMQRILRPGGQLVFSTFGTSALCELKMAWALVDEHAHVNKFCSVQDIEKILQACGFENIEVFSHVYHSKYASVLELMRELKGIGAHNVNQARNKQLTGKGRLQALATAYPQDKLGGITASFEIIYVRAMKAAMEE